MSEQIPAISVLLPVYNGAPYLTESIDSILSQTWQDFELIIINDGSRDESAEIIRSYRDPRIRYFEQENIGLAATLNRGIGLAKGQYIARQDQDDISLPQRFSRQIACMEANPKCGLVGTWAEIWSEHSKTERSLHHPPDNLHLQFSLVFDNPFVHSSVMLRREVLDVVGVYSTDHLRQPPEDYELWSRVARNFEVANIPEELLVYREVPASMSRDKNNSFVDRLVAISAENLGWWLQLPDSDERCRVIAALAHGMIEADCSGDKLKTVRSCLHTLAGRVETTCHVPQATLCQVADEYFIGLKFNYYRQKYGNSWARFCTIKDHFSELMFKRFQR